MKCKLKISAYCLKSFRKIEVKYIKGLECCEYCFNKHKKDNKKWDLEKYAKDVEKNLSLKENTATSVISVKRIQETM